MKQIVKKISAQTTVTLLTGLYIGGGNDSVQIGGLDRSVIRAILKDNQPYIPGSSLRGKMRCLLEQVRGCKLGESEEVNNLFGFSNVGKSSKIIFRDSYLIPESVAEFKKVGIPYTESKTENSIKRIEGTAENPRTTERVPAGAEFAVEMILNIWDGDNEAELKAMLEEGIRLIENDYLGGSGSRGYGQVKFEDVNYTVVYPNSKE